MHLLYQIFASLQTIHDQVTIFMKEKEKQCSIARRKVNDVVEHVRKRHKWALISQILLDLTKMSKTWASRSTQDPLEEPDLGMPTEEKWVKG